MHLCNAKPYYIRMYGMCTILLHRFVGKLYHVAITLAVVYVTQGPVEIVQGKECDIVHAARQVNLPAIVNFFFLCSLVCRPCFALYRRYSCVRGHL